MSSRVRIRKTWMPAHTYEYASRLVRTAISEDDIGCSEFNYGEIAVNGRIVAHVSYNGRVWSGGRRDSGDEIVSRGEIL